MQRIVKFLLVPGVLVALGITSASADPATVRITVQDEAGSIALPLNQPVGAWTKIYGMGFHNAEIPASMGWSMGWTLHRVGIDATFTGQPLVATEVGVMPKEGQRALSPAEAAAIAQSLGLHRSQPDPNMPGATLWPGEHLNLRYVYDKASDESLLEIWTDRFPDPSGTLPEPE